MELSVDAMLSSRRLGILFLVKSDESLAGWEINRRARNEPGQDNT